MPEDLNFGKDHDTPPFDGLVSPLVVTDVLMNMHLIHHVQSTIMYRVPGSKTFKGPAIFRATKRIVLRKFNPLSHCVYLRRKKHFYFVLTNCID